MNLTVNMVIQSFIILNSYSTNILILFEIQAFIEKKQLLPIGFF